ncbi:hypothetical protein NPIL_103601 [Nephila pilipes]|uniref:Uncharacterized protein n=1 Tax=Nephila pilipes TaxID=299642 RepID=A0A8X6PXD3_NEPPI|nr:hypothetical protein NPIL_103601 [Nephila pilipes]
MKRRAEKSLNEVSTSQNSLDALHNFLNRDVYFLRFASVGPPVRPKSTFSDSRGKRAQLWSPLLGPAGERSGWSRPWLAKGINSPLQDHSKENHERCPSGMKFL